MEQIFMNAILSNLQKEIIENKETINKVNEIDMKYCKRKVDIKKVYDLIESYKNKVIKSKSKELLIYCNGNIYIVLNLIIIAIYANMSLKIDIDENMLGVNTCILKIINKILINNEMDIKIEIVNQLKQDNIIFIDRINDYNILKRKYKNMKFVPYECLDVFCDNEKYQTILDKVYKYALNMNIDIDIFDGDEGINSVLEYGIANKVLFLTDKKVNIQNKTNKKIYINKNPFKDNNIVFEENIVQQLL